MRFAARSFAIAAVLAAYALLGSAVTARTLAALPPRTRPNLDPLGTAVGAGGVLLAFALYALLGRHVARAGGTRGDALRAGALAGVLAGTVGAAAQALALAGYLAALVAGYGAPDWFLPLILGAYVIVAIALATGFAAVVSWLSFTSAGK